jgi:hypothetical protein
MIFNHLKNFFVSAAAFLVLAGTAVPALAAPVKNIVLVHGAFVDGSGWKGVYDILVKDGYNVTLVQQPLTSLAEDVAATKLPTCRASRPSSWRTRRCSLRLRCSQRPLPTPPGN